MAKGGKQPPKIVVKYFLKYVVFFFVTVASFSSFRTKKNPSYFGRFL